MNWLSFCLLFKNMKPKYLVFKNVWLKLNFKIRSSCIIYYTQHSVFHRFMYIHDASRKHVYSDSTFYTQHNERMCCVNVFLENHWFKIMYFLQYIIKTFILYKHIFLKTKNKILMKESKDMRSHNVHLALFREN